MASIKHANVPTSTTIAIHKMAGVKKDAVRVSCEDDIPDFLFGTVTIDPFAGKIVLACIEGEQRCPLGSVIAFEKADTPTGWNAWHKANADTTLVEVEGVFYEKPQTSQAQEMTDIFPSFLNGADIWRNKDGSWSIQTPWGVSTGMPGKAYWVRYGTREDGTPDANILTVDTPSFEAYIVADPEGNDICSLPEWHARHLA